MWAVGEAAAYRLHLPRLYGRVLPHKCRTKVNQVGWSGWLGLGLRVSPLGGSAPPAWKPPVHRAPAGVCLCHAIDPLLSFQS